MEFDRWVSSFDSNFWMTQEERNELAVKQQAAVEAAVEARTREEQEAVDGLFSFFRDATDRTTPPVLDESEIQLGSDIEDAVVNEIMDNHNPFAFDMSQDGFLSESNTHESRSTIHEIPKQQQIVPNKECDMDAIPVTKECNVIPVDNEERDRREEERAENLEEKNSRINTIVKYTTRKHKVGIEGTEKTKKRKSRSEIDNPGKKLKTGGKKVQNKERASNTKKKKMDAKKISTSSKRKNKVCVMFWLKKF